MENREKCVSCGVDTPYHYDTSIEYRDYYIEGGGQLCKTCYEKTFANVD